MRQLVLEILKFNMEAFMAFLRSIDSVVAVQIYPVISFLSKIYMTIVF